ncbi:FAD:protein FMN transferase [Natronoflexus pectinivorans]|nr:FAD:protein FMN transferase [Natronoflexus pectinivorans]
MGTRLNVVIPRLTNANGLLLADEIEKVVKSEENRLSCFMVDSDVSFINSNAIIKPVSVTDEMSEVLNLSQKFNTETSGAFDPALYFYTQATRDESYIDEQGSLGWKDVLWNPLEKQLFIKNPRTGLDYGGFGKGWALEKILKLLKKHKVDSAFISFGESSISVIGEHPLGKSWPLSITHPQSGALLELELNGQSVSVSGLKRSENNDNLKSHVIRSVDFTSIKDHNIVVVSTDSPMISEVLSTAITSANELQIKTIKMNFPKAKIYQCRQDMLEFERIN